MSLKIYVPKTEILNRPILDQRITFRLYKDLMTDLLEEAHQYKVSVNERVLNILEKHFSQVMTYSFSYGYELRPLWKKRQADRRRTMQGNV